MTAHVLLAHVGHWIWQLAMFAPILLVVVGLLIQRIRGGGETEPDDADAEEARAQRELDEILGS
ncbi:MAG: hypothetical protein GEU88_19255 [Solirubrobacterales bacterium]|nr:hypothetical protein [Solirubrobacterales bacterium]